MFFGVFRPFLYGEKLSRAEGSPAYRRSIPGEPTFHTFSLQNAATGPEFSQNQVRAKISEKNEGNFKG